MSVSTDDQRDARARRRAALLSVAAAVVLVAVKLVTGLVTGSLAFVAEAVHSGTDFVAALLTLFAVRLAIRPPDREHHYGHGKAEHLAALGESAFLVVVSVFIAAESLRRLIDGGGHDVETAWWAFTVLGAVIGLDTWRAVASRRAARRYHSAAFAANALHFGSDLAGSLAVLIGLLLVAAGEPAADAAAALFVAGLVVIAGLRLARQSVDVLMDRAAADAEERIRAALERIGDHVELRRVRVRHAAERHFVDLVVGVAPDTGVTQAHAAADAIEDAVGEELGAADVVVHVEPVATAGDLRARATAAASAAPEVREVHNVRAMRLPDGYELSLHVKLPQELSLTEAHDVVEQLEQRLREEVPELRDVHTHIEPLARTDFVTRPDTDETEVERRAIEDTVRGVTGSAPVRIGFRDGERGRIALVTIALPGEQPLPSAHRDAGAIEEAVRERCPSLADVIVHTEPEEAPAPPTRAG
ncbi:MAG TPA: cation diffusion facilitator family transporter [Thermoleophilaceae bacterium]|nr:cation diffusion facilitator family transporter [Thermoleophilaceae bacterium]